jgi:hypothetical protein
MKRNAIAFFGRTQMTSPASRLSQGFAALAATAFAGIALAQAPAAAPAATAPATAATAAPDGACTECGVVKSVTAIENRARPTGRSAGARAYAEKKVETKHTVKQYWSVVVMMDDGSTRKLTYKSKPQFREGDRVSMDNPGQHVTRVAD